MAVKAGRRLILEVGDGASPEVFTQVAGLTETGFTINNEGVDITNKDSAGWRTFLADANIKSISISADGRPDDVAVSQTILADAYSSTTLTNYKLVYNSDGTTWDTITGAFQVTSYERSGPTDDGETFSITLESSGTPTFAVDQS